MFGPRLTRIFASRWNALWWGASILLLAWQLVPAQDDDPSAPATPATAPAANPWALASPTGGR
ncbi:hypothetical protein ACFOD9_01775 [Novosphingobium bradum]|uniref:Uncharacterized protein n=1 Tax=Novosphingobium bradum TaxID=1737444 RepID=A0ABV7IQM5_9SPHN